MIMRALLFIPVLFSLAACAASPARTPDFEPVMPIADTQAVAAPGAIYRAQSGGLSLFADSKARAVGDLLTIMLVEKTVSSSKATTSITKDSGVEIAAPTFFGQTPTLNGAPISTTAGAGRDFSGNGDSAQSNRLEGSVTVTVAQRLSNGNLVVRGQKQLRLNQGDEYVQIQGIVRQADITPDNTILSSRIADARIVYSGRGALAKSNVMGWLGRFFQSPAFPL
jgi:flagellar L-ring protein FlgH